MVSILLARIIAPASLILAFALLVNSKMIRTAFDEFQNGQHKMLVLLTGCAHMLLGLVLIEIHNVWIFSWPLIITIIGWLLFLRGVFLLVIPNTVMSMAKILHQRKWWIYVAAGILFLIGAILSSGVFL